MEAIDFERLYPQGLLCSIDDVPEGYGAIYLITNLANGKVYVGQTWWPIHTRWRGHLQDAKNSARKNSMVISRAIKAHGKENFSVGLLGVANSQECLDNLESVWIVLLNSQNTTVGYNTRSGGSRGRTNPATAEKMSKIIKEMWTDPAFQKKVAEGVATEEAQEKLRIAHERQSRNPELAAKRSKISLQNWANPDFRKKQMDARNSPESREKLLSSRSSPEYRQGASERAKAQWKNPDFRKKRAEMREKRKAITAEEK